MTDDVYILFLHGWTYRKPSGGTLSFPAGLALVGADIADAAIAAGAAVFSDATGANLSDKE
jgi:hypothetical protein